jgi:hypothetical protein
VGAEGSFERGSLPRGRVRGVSKECGSVIRKDVSYQYTPSISPFVDFTFFIPSAGLICCYGNIAEPIEDLHKRLSPLMSIQNPIEISPFTILHIKETTPICLSHYQ